MASPDDAGTETYLATTIIVSGALANKCHNGGAAWTRLSWALGLRHLGFHVFFIEQISPEHCVDGNGVVTAFEDSVNLVYFRRVIDAFGLSGSAALIYDAGAQIEGATWDELVETAASAALLVNISGHLTLEPLVRYPRRKAFIDLDPGFTQYWHAMATAPEGFEEHDLFFTIGENIGTPECQIPTSGIDWRPIRQPVVLDLWPASHAGNLDRFTTVASWRGPYGRVEFGGHSFGLKVHEFRKFIDVPSRVDTTFEIALDIHPADSQDLCQLREHGWTIVDPSVVAPDPDTFQRYVQTSGAEFSVAQGIYVETRSGWMSDRTVRYLASGKPALVQDTGLDRFPLGEGLLTFRTIEEAAAGAERIASNYDQHADMARKLAEDVFDSDVVLGRLIDIADIAP